MTFSRAPGSGWRASSGDIEPAGRDRTARPAEPNTNVPLETTADRPGRRSTADWVQQRQIDPAPSQEIDGLGDDAFSQTVSAGGQVVDDLWVRKNSINFRLEVLSDLGPGPLEPLARTVLTHL